MPNKPVWQISAVKSETLLYAADVSPLHDSALFEAALAAVSAGRREKTLRYAFRADQNLSLGAELLLQKALRDFGLKEPVPSFKTGEHGKPYLVGDEVPFFSLSHAGSWVLCAVSSGECGCDIEKIRNIDLNIARRFFCPGEVRAIEQEAGETQKADMFFRLWTLKESYMKATALGMSLPFDAFEISLTGGVPALLGESAKDYRLEEYGEIEGYKTALCTTVIGSRAELKIKDIL